MKFRLILVALSFILSFLVPADRVSDSRSGTWTRISATDNFPQGLGINIHFTDPRPGEIQMIANAGFRWIRMDLKWEATEKQKGAYDFSAYDRLMASLEPHNIRALFILDYGNPLYDNGAPPRTTESRIAFARWAVAAAKHFAGRDVLWETYNEPNTKMFWPPHPNADEYITLALEVARLFRAQAPKEKLIGPATSGIDFTFLESCFRAGLLDYWSAVSVHPYRQSNPETAANDYYELRKLIEKYQPTGDSHRIIPIISSEWGYSSVWRRMSDENQSVIYAREILTNIANGLPVSIWYDWCDDGLNPTEPEHHFGLVRDQFEPDKTRWFVPKLAFVAAKTFNTAFDGYSFEKRLPIGGDADYVLVFQKGGSLRYAAWTTSAPHNILLPVNGQSAQLVTHLGVSRLITTKQYIPIELSSAPIFIVPD